MCVCVCVCVCVTQLYGAARTHMLARPQSLHCICTDRRYMDATHETRLESVCVCVCVGEYQLACEHAHSCCVLLARPDRFLRNGRWHTWIDYDKFQELAASGQPFTSTGMWNTHTDMHTHKHQRHGRMQSSAPAPVLCVCMSVRVRVPRDIDTCTHTHRHTHTHTHTHTQGYMHTDAQRSGGEGL